MAPIVAYHATRRCTRQSIRENGLYPGSRHPIYGVYVYDDSGEWDHPTRGRSWGARRIYWSCGPHQDVWRVSYIGPLTPDPYVTNGIALLERVSPDHVTLVTGNNQ